MSSGGRNAPEWFGGGTGPAPGISSIEKDTMHRGSKKKHRRSKSDTSYLKSSSRKAAERERRERSKEKSKSKKHRRGKSRDIATNSIVEDAEDAFKAQRLETKPNSSSLINDGTNSRNHRKEKTSHKRSNTMPHQMQKKGSFIERIFGLGRSDNSPKNSEQQSVEPTGTASSIHFHVHKIEEKIDPEELLHPLAPPTSVLPSAQHNLPYLEAPPKPEDRGGYHPSHLTVISNQRAYVHPKSNSPNTTSGVIDHGAESDDLLTYSDDDTANSISYHPYQQPIAPSSLYPTYQTNEYNRNHESYQVLQQQRLIALSHAQPNAKTNYRANSNSNGMNTYGSINDLGIDLLPPLHRDQQKISHKQDRFFMLTNRESNDFYISEDDTLTSAHTQETYRNLDNFYFERIKHNENMPISPRTLPNETEHLLGPTQEDINAEKQESSPNSVNDLLDLDITNHRGNLKLDDGLKSSGNQVFGSTNIDDTTGAMMDQLSQKSSSNKDDNISASSGSSNRKTPPPNRSHSSDSANGSNKAPPTLIQNIEKPPPISSVQIFRTSGTETTVGSNSSSSPHTTMLKKSSSSSSHKIQLAALSRKEKKRLRKKIDRAEKIEDYVQFLLHEHSGDDTFLLESTHENYSNLNARFFPQSEKARDVFFSFLFLIQFAIVVFLAFNNADETMLHNVKTVTDEDPYSMYNTDDPFATGYLPNDNSSPISIWAKDIYVDYTNAVQLACITALYSTVLSALAIGMMMILNSAFIPTVLCVTVLACIGAGTIMALSPYTVMPVVALAALAISLAYSIVVWDRIPFATTNLHTALVCIKSSADILLAGFAMMLIAFFWTIIWMVAFLGIYDHYLDNADHELRRSISWDGLSVSLGMILSYIWTFNVILNIVHVTVAGIVGSWWTSADSLSSCCTSVFREHFVEAITNSFGSICLGSLVVPPLGMLNFFLLFICPQSFTKARSLPLSMDHSGHDVGSIIGDKSIKSDMSPASTYANAPSPLDGVTRYFNDFGFTYIGLYRSGFVASSEKATDVFQAREWSGIVSDRLIHYVLLIICVLITFASGSFGLVVDDYDGYNFTNFQKPTSTAFIIGCYIGFMLSRVCLQVVESAVSAVLVCFSVAPYPFKHYHPVLSSEMRGSWGGVWLDEVSLSEV